MYLKFSHCLYNKWNDKKSFLACVSKLFVKVRKCGSADDVHAVSKDIIDGGNLLDIDNRYTT